VPEKPPKSHAHTSRTRFFAPFWQTTTSALHSLKPDFQQLHASSRPRSYSQKTQLPDSAKDFPKEHLQHSHFRHLKYHIAGMADHLDSYLDELVERDTLVWDPFGVAQDMLSAQDFRSICAGTSE